MTRSFHGILTASAYAIGCIAWTTTAMAQDKTWVEGVREFRDALLPPPPPPPTWSPDGESPNAAARYAWLYQRMDPGTARSAGWVDVKGLQWTVAEDQEETTRADVERLLEASKQWIDAYIEASRLPEFRGEEEHRPGFGRVPDSDPRHFLYSNRRKAFRIVRADAVRLWATGDHQAGATRVAALIRHARQHADDNPGSLTAIITDAELAISLTLASEMIDADRGGPWMEELVAAARSLRRDDPAAMKAAWRSNQAVMSAFVAANSKDGEIGLPLYRMIASLKGADEFIQGVMSNVLEGKKEILPPRDRLMADMMGRFREDMPEVTPEAVGAAHQRARALGAELDARWDEPESDEFFRQAAEEIDADPTEVLKLILLVPRQQRKAWRERVDQLAGLLDAQRDPAPVVVPLPKGER